MPVIQFEEGLPETRVAGNGAAQLLDPLRPLRSPKLAIVGFSETTRHLAPWDDESTEIWICNRLGLQPGISRWDRHFDPHHLTWSSRNHKPEDWRTYSEWLGHDYGERLVYLPGPEPEAAAVPNCVPFPLEEVIACTGRRYFASGIGWQIGLALLLHQMYGSPTWIGLYGIDLRGLQEYEFQRPNAEWLLGLAVGRGIDIELPNESALLNQDGRCPLYGFDTYGGALGEAEKAAEARVVDITKRMEELNAQNEDLIKQLHTLHGHQQEAASFLQRIQQYRRGGKF